VLGLIDIEVWLTALLCVRACVRACVRECVRACVCVCVCMLKSLFGGAHLSVKSMCVKNHLNILNSHVSSTENAGTEWEFGRNNCLR
jgi:hypothetical protein